MFQYQSRLSAELTKLYRTATAFLGQSGSKVVEKIASLLHDIEDGWSQLRSEENFRHFREDFDSVLMTTKARVASTVDSVRYEFFL
jgi:ElaB/YqjD/DUF883 family membrane-anchored ribosome-binding protein